MDNLIKIIITILFITVFVNFLSGQKIIKSEGQAQHRQESYMSANEAFERAIELAIINAIENAFGTYVEQQMDMLIEDGNTSYNIIGSTKVMGEWIETIGEPEISIDTRKENTNYGKQNVNYISCRIKGKVRALVPRAILNYEIMNAPNLESRTRSFYNKEQLYVYFKSPISGYVSIFLQDREGVSRILPYEEMEEKYVNGVIVDSDEEYIFFSKSHKFYTQKKVDEIEICMDENKPVEYNILYIIFSEEEYIKPSLVDSKEMEEYKIPQSLSKKNFEKWLSKNRISSKSFQVIKEKISVKHPK